MARGSRRQVASSNLNVSHFDILNEIDSCSVSSVILVYHEKKFLKRRNGYKI